MQELLLSVLLADNVGLGSTRVAKLQEGLEKWKNILEDHGLRFSRPKSLKGKDDYMTLPFSDWLTVTHKSHR